MLDDALGNQGIAVYHFASLILFLDTAYVNGEVLDMVDVTEARQLRKTTCQRSLTAFEAVALAAARTGLLTVQTTTGGLTGARCGTATYALTVATRTLSGLRSLSSMFSFLLFRYLYLTY